MDPAKDMKVDLMVSYVLYFVLFLNPVCVSLSMFTTQFTFTLYESLSNV